MYAPTILRRLYLIGMKKGIFEIPKRVVGTISQFAEQLNGTGLSKDHILKVLYDLEKKGVLEQTSGYLYRINEQKLLELLSDDELFNLDKEIIEIRYFLVQR